MRNFIVKSEELALYKKNKKSKGKNANLFENKLLQLKKTIDGGLYIDFEAPKDKTRNCLSSIKEVRFEPNVPESLVCYFKVCVLASLDTLNQITISEEELQIQISSVLPEELIPRVKGFVITKPELKRTDIRKGRRYYVDCYLYVSEKWAEVMYKTDQHDRAVAA